MNRRIVVTGTDTGIGKTVFSAGLADFLGASYWKPVQAGLEGETYTEAVGRLGGLFARSNRIGALSPSNASLAASFCGHRWRSHSRGLTRTAGYRRAPARNRGSRRADGAAQWRHTLY